MRILVQDSETFRHSSIRSALESYLRLPRFGSLHVAMAYATISGVRAMIEAARLRGALPSQWLLGLDDCLTQPGAIELLRRRDAAEVRVASLAASAFRFHPKVIFLRSPSESDLFTVGSANLTSSGLHGNAEAVVFLESDTPSEKHTFARAWKDLWSQGHTPTAAELRDYTRRYEQAKRLRARIKKKVLGRVKRAPKTSSLILDQDDAELDPSLATTCWIECGFVTALGRELEFKAEQGLFFGLDPAGGKAKTFSFRTSDGRNVRLRMKYQENHMWRLQMNNEVPEVRSGLRPKCRDGRLGRSHYVAVFSRTDQPDLIDLRFVHLQSKNFTRLCAASARLGTVGYTTARTYGWC